MSDVKKLYTIKVGEMWFCGTSAVANVTLLVLTTLRRNPWVFAYEFKLLEVKK